MKNLFSHKTRNTADGAIDIFTFGDPTVSKNSYLITGGKHGGEVEGVNISWRIVEMLKEKAGEYHDTFFVVMPELCPAQSKQAMDDILSGRVKGSIKSFRNKYRNNSAGMDLNRNYAICGEEATLLADQTRIIMDFHERYDFDMMLDFHSHMRVPFTHYVCGNPYSVAVAKRLSNINGNGWRTYLHNSKEKLIGYARRYFGVWAEVGFITVELGACPRRRDFRKHCDTIWDEQFPALDWLFRQNLSDFS